MNSIYLSNISPWAPGLAEDSEAWKAWAMGNMEISQDKESPKLEYTDPLFRRRLSQISKMTVQVVHNLLEKENIDKDTKIVFVSLRGEIEREFTINKGLIEDGIILPAGFSLSVFNTPVALATLAFKLTGGYSVLYPSKNNFADAFKTAVAPILAGTEKQIIFVYADEVVPKNYGDKTPKDNTPLAFATLITSEKKDNSIEISDFSQLYESPSEFLKFVIQ